MLQCTTLDQKGHNTVTIQSASKYQHNVICDDKDEPLLPCETKAGIKYVALKPERILSKGEDFIHAVFNSGPKRETTRGPHSRGMMILHASTQK